MHIYAYNILNYEYIVNLNLHCGKVIEITNLLYFIIILLNLRGNIIRKIYEHDGRIILHYYFMFAFKYIYAVSLV